MTEAERQARYKYRAKGKRISLDFYQTEMDLVEWLEQQPKTATYIKDLIRADMDKQKEK